MSEILVFGHKSPDTDTVTSAFVMAEFEKKLGNSAKACRLGDLNKETKFVFDYLGIEAPMLIESVSEGQDIILVDHNEAKQSIDGRDKANILKVIDHHPMDFAVGYPIYYRAEPVGCTATVLYKMFKENGLEIDKNLATLMISAIISDTLLFKSPTCTSEDKEAVSKLNEIAGLDIEKYGMDMLKAGTDLSDYSAEELINLDAKEFSIAGKTVVAQVNTASIEEMMQRKDELESAMNTAIKSQGLDLFMLIITDIINSNSQTIALGNNSSLVEKSYNVKLENNTAFLPGVVSRKKQVIPVLTENAK